MAEAGRTNPLDNEIRAAIAAGTAQNLFIGVGFSSPKTIELEFEVSRDFPLVTMVTMVAPSGLVRRRGGLRCKERRVGAGARGPGHPWDAGTDSGASFMSNDPPTVPRQPIALFPPSLAASRGRHRTFRLIRLPNPLATPQRIDASGAAAARCRHEPDQHQYHGDQHQRDRMRSDLNSGSCVPARCACADDHPAASGSPPGRPPSVSRRHASPEAPSAPISCALRHWHDTTLYADDRDSNASLPRPPSSITPRRGCSVFRAR